ncbi:MAG: Crp/Fnr family transcriptional regulator [Ferruginibacter sp.]
MIDIDLLLAWGASYKKVSAHEIIFHESQNCSFYYQLVSGKVRWVNIDDEGKECIHFMIEEGESFGELPLFDNFPYAATAIAEQDSIVLRLHKSTFIELIKENSDIHFAITQLFCKRLRFKLAIIKSFASNCPEVKITTLLNYFKTETNNFFINRNQLNLTRQQIADMTGLRVETVIRTMRHMHDKGDLLIKRGKVFCNNMTERIFA